MNAIDVYSGAGGMSLGFEQAGITTLLRAEANRDAATTLVAAVARDHLAPAVNIGDTLAYDKWPTADLVYGGPPCQAFSVAGNRRGLSDPRAQHLGRFLEIVVASTATYFVMENVRISGQLQHVHDAFMAQAEDMGYYVTFGMYNAADFGTPQTRVRSLYIGSRHREVLIPTRTTKRWRTVREALDGVAPGEGARYTELDESVFAEVPEGGNWKDLPYATRHIVMGSNILRSGGGRTRHAARLAWDRPSPTIMTNVTRRSTGFCHPDETRPLSIAECAALQDFPRDYPFHGSMTERYKQVGNAMPSRLAYAAAIVVKAAFDARQDAT